MNLKFIVIFLIPILGLLFASCNTGDEKSNAVATLPSSPSEVNPLKIGDTIPQLTLVGIDGKEFSLNNAFRQKPTILIYYRGGWCLYCNQHLGQVQEIEQDLFDLGFQIIAISADISDKIAETISKHNIHYTIISDPDLEGAKALGLAYSAENLYNDMLEVLEEFSGKKHHILPVPAAFIVNQDGIIQFTYVNPDFTIRITPELLLTAARVSLEE